MHPISDEGDSPLVSIVIPVYNGSNYLSQAIESALAQTYGNCEVIVVNDGSDDNDATATIARSYGNRIIYSAKENGGVASALNHGINSAKGKYISWLSHDDVYHPTKIADQIRHAASLANPDTSIIYSDFDILEEGGRRKIPQRMGLSPPPPDGGENARYRHQMLKIFFTSAINGCSMLIPRSLFFTIGKFDESRITTQDYHIWMLFHRFGVIFSHLPGVRITIRHHREQNTHTQKPLHLIELTALYRWAFDVFIDEFQDMPIWLFDDFLKAMSARKLDRVYAYMLSGWANGSWNRGKPIIWLYWENKPESTTPFLIQLCWRTVVLANRQNFRIQILSDIDIDALLPGMKSIYRRLREIAHRADYIRFKLLHRHGGIWLDSDTICLRSLADLIPSIQENPFICATYKNERSEQFPVISFVAGQPGNEISLEILNHMESAMEDAPQTGEIVLPWDFVGSMLSQRISQKRQGCLCFRLGLFSPFPAHDHNLERVYTNARHVLIASDPNAYCQNIAYSRLSASIRNASERELLEGENIISELLRLALHNGTDIRKTPEAEAFSDHREKGTIARSTLTSREVRFIYSARRIYLSPLIKLPLVYLARPCYRFMRMLFSRIRSGFST